MDNAAGRQSRSENLNKIELTVDSGGCVPLQLDRCVEVIVEVFFLHCKDLPKSSNSQ